MTEVLERNRTNDVLGNEEILSLLEKYDGGESNLFNEIVKLGDRDIQNVLRLVDKDELAKALKTANIDVKNKIYKNMTKRASTMLKEDIEFIISEHSNEAQENIISIIYYLVYTGEIIPPENFHFPAHFDMDVLTRSTELISDFNNIEEFQTFLTERRQPEKPYGLFPHTFSHDITMCRFFESKNGEGVLADIEQKNREQGMGNFQIPNTNIKLINYSICPQCGHIFSFKDLTDYYSNPQPDQTFKNRAEQYREDTRVLCKECNTYFLPALVIADGTPQNEVQFLCRVQTTNAIEKFYQDRNGIKVLSAKTKNILKKEEEGKIVRAIRNDVLLRELTPKPTLISNLLQYTPAHLVVNLIDGTNAKKGDVLFGNWY